MCRLLGIVASEPTHFELWLRTAPRSLAALSHDHPDGWGMAVFHDPEDLPNPIDSGDWEHHRDITTADEDREYHRLAAELRGRVLVAHIRQRTVGPLAVDNTHPFRWGRWVFAHNGTVGDLDWLRSTIPPARLSQLRGTTDSELLFASLLGALDAAGLADCEASDPTDEVVRRWTLSMRERLTHVPASESSGPCALGAASFVLSDGRVLYAHRWRRSLFCLRRVPGDPVRTSRSAVGLTLHTGWSDKRNAILVASERLTDEPWDEVAEGALLKVDRREGPQAPLNLTA